MKEKLLMPGNIEELQENLNSADENTRFISGGTDMILNLRKNGFGDLSVIDLSGISELKYIAEKDDIITIGAGMTLSAIAENEIIKRHAPMLAKAADSVGSTQIRNAATIGGNVANSFAGADLIPPLIALKTELLLLGKNSNRRTVKIEEFLLGNRKNCLEIGEIVSEIRFLKPSSIQYFGKIGSRSRVTISKLNMAASIVVDEGIIKSSDVVFGAIGTTAFRSSKIENFLNGKEIKKIDLYEMSESFTDQVDEAIPGRASRVYKREAIISLATELHRKLNMEVEI